MSLIASSQTPLLREMEWAEPHVLFHPHAREPFALLLDSALIGDKQGRWSFIALDPYESITLRDAGSGPDPFHVLKFRLGKFASPYQSDLPPFIGGAAGFFGYDLAHALERLPPKAPPFALDDQNLPDLAVGLYDTVAAFDHELRRAFIVSSGAGGRDPIKRTEEFSEKLQLSKNVRHVEVAPCAPVRSNFSREAYEAAVAKIIDYILAGDIFQANLSQRFEAEMPLGGNPYELYLKLRARNPAPFASFFNFGVAQLISSSPERFLSCRNGHVLTQPIKGTRPRGESAAEDMALAQALVASEKDRAENVMIVDLLRNDLSKVCRNNSVKVEQLCALESFANVHHLVSTISGELKGDADAIDLLAACFPGGSITGAPKLRAMEIIAELEPTTRGPYCGAIGYIGFDGSMDTSIAIRTMIAKGRRITFQAGGGVVADSDPATEYAESLTKAAAMRHALEQP